MKYICTRVLSAICSTRAQAGRTISSAFSERLAEFFTEEEIVNARVEKDYTDIFSGSKAVIIENKIGADYRDNQLGKYQKKLIGRGLHKRKYQAGAS